MGIKDKAKRVSKYFINEQESTAANGTAKGDKADAADAVDKADADKVDAEGAPDKAAPATEEAKDKVELTAADADKAVASEAAGTEAAAGDAEAAPVADETAKETTEADKAGKLAAEGEKAKKSVKDSEPRYKNDKKDFLKRLFNKLKKKNPHDRPAAAPVESDRESPAPKEQATDAAKAAVALQSAEETAEPASSDAAAAAAAASSEKKEAQLPEVENAHDDVEAAARALGERADEAVAATKEAIEAKWGGRRYLKFWGTTRAIRELWYQFI